MEDPNDDVDAVDGLEKQQSGRDKLDILYGVDDRPPWLLCILLAFQQFLTAFGSMFAIPIILSGAVCVAGDWVGLGEIISTVVFVTGISSILQTTLGIRLPIVQSTSASFITPIITIMIERPGNCPYTDPSFNASLLPEKGSDEHKAIWMSNMCEIQGSLMVASLLSILIGFSGLVGFMMRFIGPLTIAPTICLIALSLFQLAFSKGSSQWYICFLTIALVAIFSQYMRNISIRVPGLRHRLKIFTLFPVLMAVVLSWVLCLVLTEAGVFPDDPKGWGYGARTDTKSIVLEKSEWFRFPYPGQWGMPTVSLAGVLGMMASILASTIESVGDYHASARLCGAPPPPGSAITRGIGVEGISCLLAGAWGMGGGTTSYSQNSGTIGITKVGSRIVIQVAGVFMILLGCLGKFGALFVNIPDPVVGGIFYVMFGMIAGVGISNLQFVNLNSSRNLFVFGLSVFFGLSVPNWVVSNKIDTGNSIANQIITVLGGTSMFVGGVLAFILDNTIPGTIEERGLLAWSKVDERDMEHLSTYDIPFIQPWINKISCFRYIPFCSGSFLDKQPCPTQRTDHISTKENGDFSTWHENNLQFKPDTISRDTRF